MSMIILLQGKGNPEMEQKYSDVTALPLLHVQVWAREGSAAIYQHYLCNQLVDGDQPVEYPWVRES